jgi:hypothetical protein
MKNLTKTLSVFLALSFLLAISGCKKDKLSPSELLLKHVWTFNKITTTSANQDIQDLVTLVGALMTNATLDFNENGTYTMTVLNQDDDGTWDLSDDGKILTMDGDDMTITKLTDSELVMDGQDVDDEYGAYNVTMYWRK